MSSFNVDERYIIFWRQTEMWCACNRNVLVLERTETSMFESRPWNSLSSSHLRLVVNSRRHKHDITIEDTYLALSPLSEGARKRRTCVRSMIIVSNTKDNRNSPVTRVSDTKWYLSEMLKHHVPKFEMRSSYVSNHQLPFHFEVIRTEGVIRPRTDLCICVLVFECLSVWVIFLRLKWVI